jgi:hypothetical protein
MKFLTNAIMQRIEKLPEGTPVSAKMLLALGTRAGVDQALSRLHRRGQLLRIGRGLYVMPVESRFGKRAPNPEKVVEAFSAQRGETIAPSPAAVANALGLTTQVPVRSIYFTSGRSRKLNLGKQQVELKHAPGWQLGAGIEGEVVRALVWGGPSKVLETLAALSKKISATEFERIIQHGSRLPLWMVEPLSRQFHHA